MWIAMACGMLMTCMGYARGGRANRAWCSGNVALVVLIVLAYAKLSSLPSIEERGNVFPRIALSDHMGQERSFESLAGGDGLLLVFYRGYW